MALYRWKEECKGIIIPTCAIFVILNIIFPVLLWMQIKDYALDITFSTVNEQLQAVVPFLSALPCALLLRKRFDSGMDEAIHMLPVLQKETPMLIVFLEIVSVILFCPLFIWLRHVYKVFLWVEFVRTILQTIYLQNLSYYTTNLIRFSAAGVLAQVIVGGGMQLSLLMPYQWTQVIEIFNIYDHISMDNPRPISAIRALLTIAVSVFFLMEAKKRERFSLSSIQN